MGSHSTDIKHANGDSVAIDTVVLLVQLLVAHDQGSRFCWQDYLGQPSQAEGVVYLHGVVSGLLHQQTWTNPIQRDFKRVHAARLDLYAKARVIVERSTKLAAQLIAA